MLYEHESTKFFLPHQIHRFLITKLLLCYSKIINFSANYLIDKLYTYSAVAIFILSCDLTIPLRNNNQSLIYLYYEKIFTNVIYAEFVRWHKCI